MSSRSKIPPRSGIEYHKLAPTDPRVLRRIPYWVKDPVIFCREASNFYPHWYQDELISDTSLFTAAAWSRQIGKSQAIAHKAIWYAFTHQDEDIIIVAPTQRQAKLLYRKITTAIRKSPLIFSSVVGKIKMEETVFSSGCQIINLPAGDEGDSIRGYTVALLIMEESAFIPDEVFVAAEQTLSSSGGQQICISTPKGRHNEFYRMFFPDDSDEHFPMDVEGNLVNGHYQVGDWSCHHYEYTAGLNVIRPDGRPQLSELHVMRQKRKLQGWAFHSEYRAQFIENIDSYFNPVMITRMFSPQFERYYEPDPDGMYFMSFDIAKGRDFSALMVARRLDYNPVTNERLSKPHLQIVNIDYWKSGEIGIQYPRLISAVETWQPQAVYFDRNSIGERPFEEMRDTYSLPVESFMPAQKINAFATLNTMMSTGGGEIEHWESRIHSYQDGEAIKQFRNLVYEIPKTTTSTGHKRIGDNIKIYAGRGHDDIPVCAAMLMLCISNPVITAPVAGAKKRQTMHYEQSARKSSVFISNSGIGRDRKNYRSHPRVFWKRW